MKTFKDFLNESINDKGIFKAVFIIGMPGAGKSYTVKQLGGNIGPKIVNTDKAAEFLAKQHGQDVNAETWSKTFKDTALRITRNSLSSYLNGMLPLFIDGTSNDASNLLHRMGILESLGYDVGIVYVKTPLELALKRVEKRNETLNRKVDLDFVREVHERTEDNVAFLKSKAGFFVEIVNTEDTYTDEVINKAFKKTQAFFGGELVNPIGKRHIQQLRDAKQAYLSPEIIELPALQKKVDGWYK
jgi:dephospho-CoA kinase